MVRKLNPMVFRMCSQPDIWISSLKTHSQERPGHVLRASDGVLVAEQVRFLDDHLEIYLPLSQRNKHNRRLRMHKSRGVVEFPRRTSSPENQAPTLITVKEFNSECFIDRAEQVDKTSVLGSLLFCSQRQNIFLFKQSHHRS